MDRSWFHTGFNSNDSVLDVNGGCDFRMNILLRLLHGYSKYFKKTYSGNLRILFDSNYMFRGQFLLNLPPELLLHPSLFFILEVEQRVDGMWTSKDKDCIYLLQNNYRCFLSLFRQDVHITLILILMIIKCEYYTCRVMNCDSNSSYNTFLFHIYQVLGVFKTTSQTSCVPVKRSVHLIYVNSNCAKSFRISSAMSYQKR